MAPGTEGPKPWGRGPGTTHKGHSCGCSDDARDWSRHRLPHSHGQGTRAGLGLLAVWQGDQRAAPESQVALCEG